MSAINFITANPFVPTYTQQTAALGAEERAVDAAARSRADWMRGEADRQAIADSQKNRIETLKAMPQPGATPAVPATPATPAAVIPGTQSAAPGQMAEAADMTAAVPATPGQPAMPGRRSHVLDNIVAMGSHPALNAQREAALTGFAQSQDTRANTLDDQARTRANQISDRIHELAASNDPTKLAMARQLADQNGVKLPDQYWTDANVRARVDAKLKAMKDQGLHPWDMKSNLQADPDMGQTPAGRVALDAANMQAPIVGAPIQTGGTWTTKPDGSSVYTPGPMYLNRGGRDLEQATDEEGNALTGTAGAGRGIRGVSAGTGGGGSKASMHMRDRIDTLVASGMPLAEALRVVAGGTGIKTFAPGERGRLANQLMKTQVDNLGRPKLTFEAALAQVDRALMPTPPAGAPPSAPGAGQAGGPGASNGANDRPRILQEERDAEQAKWQPALDAWTNAAKTGAGAEAIARAKAEFERVDANVKSLDREMGRNGSRPAAATPPAAPATSPSTATPTPAAPAKTGRITPDVEKWAASSKAKGTDAKAALAELKSKGYTKEEAIQILRKGGY